MITKDLLKKYANNLLLDMNDKEYETLLKEFDVILRQMDLINNISGISEVEPMHFPYELGEVILRGDDVNLNIPLNDVLKNSTNILHDQIKVPKVVE